MKMLQSTSYKEAFAELRNITTIDWACKAASFLEKGLWAFIGIIGTIWAVYFISLQFISFDENASVLIQGNSEETELKYPAITICPKVATKSGIVERLANYIDPDKLPEKFMQLKKSFFECAFSGKTKGFALITNIFVLIAQYFFLNGNNLVISNSGAVFAPPGQSKKKNLNICYQC